MPIYEYRCGDCSRRTSVFVRRANAANGARCEHCGGKKLTRLVSKFAVHRPGIDFDDPSSMDDLDQDDPQAVARWARKMGEESGEDMGPEFEEMIQRIERGEDPDALMGGDDGGGLDDDDDEF